MVHQTHRTSRESPRLYTIIVQCVPRGHIGHVGGVRLRRLGGDLGRVGLSAVILPAQYVFGSALTSLTAGAAHSDISCVVSSSVDYSIKEDFGERIVECPSLHCYPPGLSLASRSSRSRASVVMTTKSGPGDDFTIQFHP